LQAPNRDYKVTFAIIAVAGGAVAVGLWARSYYPADAVTATEDGAAGAVHVEAEPVALETIELAVMTRGFLEPFETITVAGEVAGAVEVQKIEVGAQTEAGSLLFEIDNEIHVTTLARAMAEVDRRKAELDRATENQKRVAKLQERDSANPVEITQVNTDRAVAEAAHKQAKAAVDEATIQIERSTVAAPTGGVISRIHIRKGEHALPGQPMADIIVVDPLKLILQLNDREVVAFAAGDPVDINVPALGGEIFEGLILVIHPRATLDTRKFEVEVTVPNPDGRLRPGFYVQATLRGAADRNPSKRVLTLSRSAVFEQYRQTYCYVVRENSEGSTHVSLAPVETLPLLSSPMRLQLVTGLEEGDLVVTSGIQHLTHGAAVELDKP
jgi:RND family efflux transporter MFP subunit